MDGALIGFSFLSLVLSQVHIFSVPFLSPDLSFFVATLFSPCPPPSFFFFFAFETFPAHPPTTPHCAPPTYSPIYLN